MLFFLAMIDNEQDKSKLEKLYAQYSRYMFYVAYQILKDNQFAEDAVQVAFEKLFKNLDKISEINCNKTQAFVVVIIRNVAINIYRKRKKERNLLWDELDANISDNKESIEQKIINEETFIHISQIIKQIHPAYADIIALKYQYDFTDAEISRILDITPENTRVRLHRARQALMKLLSQDEELSING